MRLRRFLVERTSLLYGHGFVTREAAKVIVGVKRNKKNCGVQRTVQKQRSGDCVSERVSRRLAATATNERRVTVTKMN